MKRLFVVAVTAVLLLTTIRITYPQAEEYKLFLPAIMDDYDANWLWQDSTTITFDPPAYGNPLAVIDIQGRLHLLWSKTSAQAFIYHTYFDGNDWSSIQAVAETNGYSKVLFNPLVDQQGHLHLVWYNNLGSGEERYRLMYAEFDGTSWLSEQEVYRTDNMYVQAMPHRDAGGNVMITLLDNSIGTTAYQLTRSGSGWGLSSAIQPGHITHWTWPDMQGGIRFYGSDHTDTLFYSRWQNGRFQVQNQQQPGEVNGRNTQLDGTNNLHAFWSGSVPIPGGTVNGLYYQCLNENLSWGPEQILTGNSAFYGTAVKSADTISQVALAWQEDERFAVGLWDGCDKVAEKDVPDLNLVNQGLVAVATNQTAKKLCVVAKHDFSSDYTAVCAYVDK